jgi:hypothetical protein
MTLRWLYTGTGNALFDAGEEEIAEWGIEPFSWGQYDDAFDAQQEAIDFLEMAIQGRKILWAAFNGESGKYRTETQTHADLLRPWRVSADE